MSTANISPQMAHASIKKYIYKMWSNSLHMAYFVALFLHITVKNQEIML